MEPHVEYGILARCDGSAKAEFMGNICVAGLFGPVEPRVLPGEWMAAAVVEVQLKSYCQPAAAADINNNDHYLSLMLRDILVEGIQTKMFPRSVISISVRVLGGGKGEGMFTTALMACVGALINANIPMLSMPVAVETGRVCLVFASESPDPCAVFTLLPGGFMDETGLMACIAEASLSANERRRFLVKNMETALANDADLVWQEDER
jgi:hypothetical protein